MENEGLPMGGNGSGNMWQMLVHCLLLDAYGLGDTYSAHRTVTYTIDYLLTNRFHASSATVILSIAASTFSLLLNALIRTY